jgi:hypothetical protein
MNSMLTSWLSADRRSKFSFYCILLYVSSLVPDRILLHSLSLFDRSATLSLFLNLDRPFSNAFPVLNLDQPLCNAFPVSPHPRISLTVAFTWNTPNYILFHWHHTAILILSFCYLLGPAFFALDIILDLS